MSQPSRSSEAHCLPPRRAGHAHGSGKTVAFRRSSALLTIKPKVLILVHRRELGSKPQTSFSVLHGITAGFAISSPSTSRLSETPARRLRTVPVDLDLIIIDEAHHAVAGHGTKLSSTSPTQKSSATASPSRLTVAVWEAISRLSPRHPSRSSQSLDSCHHTEFSRRPLRDQGTSKLAQDYAKDDLSSAMDAQRLRATLFHYRRLGWFTCYCHAQ